MIFACPHCGQQLSSEEEIGGMEICCPKCAGRFHVALRPTVAVPPNTNAKQKGFPKSAMKYCAGAAVLVVLLAAILPSIFSKSGSGNVSAPTIEARTPAPSVGKDISKPKLAPPAPTPAKALDLVSLVKRTRSAVVLVEVFDASKRKTATGSGFFISSNGLLTTNYHVIRMGQGADVRTDNGEVFQIRGAVGIDRENDLVLLAVEGNGFSFLPLGDSEKVDAGARIAVIGSPLGLEGSISEGIVAAKHRSFGQQEWLQITAPISHGSSGSPVMDLFGNVVGVATMILKSGQSLNFAVPVRAVENLKLHPLEEMQDLRVVWFNYLMEMQQSPEMKAYKDANLKAMLADNAGQTKILKARLERSAAWLKRYAEAKENSKKMDELFQENSPLEQSEPEKEFRDLQGWERVYFLAKNLVAHYPDIASNYYSLGSACEKLGLVDEAIAAYRESIKLHESVSDWHRLGEIFRDNGRTVQSERAFNKAVEFCQKELQQLSSELATVPSPWEVHHQKVEVFCDLGDSYDLLGNSEAAKQAYLQAIREYEIGKQTCLNAGRNWSYVPDPQPYFKLVQIYVDEGNEQEAFNAAYTVMLLNPNHKDAKAEARDFVLSHKSRRSNR